MPQHRRLTLRLEHAYFPDGLCAEARIAPRPATARLLQRHRIGLRERPAGLDLIVAFGEQGVPAVPLPTGYRLDLLVCADNPALLLYTDLAGVPGGSLVRFNGLLSKDGGLKFRRAGTAPCTADDSAAAVVLVTVPGAWLEPGAARAAATAVLRLPASAANWRYYCVLPRTIDPATLAIVQRRSEKEPRRIEFAPSGRIDFGDAAEAGDAVARGLGSRFPGRRIVALTSSAPVPARALACPHLTLMSGEQILVERLPSPPLSRLLAAQSLSDDDRPGVPIAFQTVDVFSLPSHDLGA
jgi:hypothetical protein